MKHTANPAKQKTRIVATKYITEIPDVDPDFEVPFVGDNVRYLAEGVGGPDRILSGSRIWVGGSIDPADLDPSMMVPRPDGTCV